ncbi:MAG: hypothetical protein ABSB12_03890, partial [Candidatus Saccharimonadales bacterium]
MKKHPKKIIKKFTIVQKVFSIFIIMAVAAGGTYLIVNSSAQSPYTAIEASTGTLTSPATTQADSSATSGQDVQFGATSSNSALAPSVMGAYAGPTNVSGVNSIGTLLGF